MTNVNMRDPYYLETIQKGTGSVIITTNDQLSNATSYLLPYLREIVSVAVRWVLKTGYHNFKSSSFILVVLFL